MIGKTETLITEAIQKAANGVVVAVPSKNRQLWAKVRAIISFGYLKSKPYLEKYTHRHLWRDVVFVTARASQNEYVLDLTFDIIEKFGLRTQVCLIGKYDIRFQHPEEGSSTTLAIRPDHALRQFLCGRNNTYTIFDNYVWEDHTFKQKQELRQLAHVANPLRGRI